MSTMYLGLGSRPRAVLPHHLSFLTQTIRSWLWVWYRYGPLPTGFSLAPVATSFSERPSHRCLGTIARLYRWLPHCWYRGSEKVNLTVRASVASAFFSQSQRLWYGTEANLPSSNVNTTSAEVSGWPSLQVRPSRRVSS